jgi:parallel beta-helix repeat protein
VPTVRGNRISKNRYRGIWIFDGGSGTFEDNDLRDNSGGAWEIAEDCLPNVTRSGNMEDESE